MIIPNSNSEPVQEVGWTDEARVAALLARRARRKKAGGNDADVKPREREDLAGARRAGEGVKAASGRETGARRATANKAARDAAERTAKDTQHRARRERDRKAAEAESKKGSSKKADDTAAKTAAVKREVAETKRSITLAKREAAAIRAAVNTQGRATRAQLDRYSELETFMAQMRRRISDLEMSLKPKRKAA
jgi:hypothetical protein